MSKVLNFTAEQVKELLPMKELIQVVEKGLANFSKGADGGVIQPVRTVFKVDHPGHDFGFFGAMPVYSANDNVLASKIGGFYPNNAKYGKLTHLTTIMLYDPAYGELKAIVDGEEITAMRTAAASAVATKHLVSSSDAPLKLALLGAGKQARSHTQAMRTLFNISQIRIWSATMESAMKCADEVGGEACLTAEEAVHDADIIVTVTFAKTPILKKAWVKPGAHINAVGSCRAEWNEIDPELMRSSVVYVDSREGALKESGDIILSKAEIYAEIGEVINGTKDVRREPVTVFKSLGMAIEDAVSAKLVYDLHLAKSHQQ